MKYKAKILKLALPIILLALSFQAISILKNNYLVEAADTVPKKNCKLTVDQPPFDGYATCDSVIKDYPDTKSKIESSLTTKNPCAIVTIDSSGKATVKPSDCKGFPKAKGGGGGSNTEVAIPPTSEDPSAGKENAITNDINIFIEILSGVVGVIIVIMIIVGGVQYSAAGDNPQAVTAAKSKITNAIIALFAFIFLFAFLNWLIPGGPF